MDGTPWFDPRLFGGLYGGLVGGLGGALIGTVFGMLPYPTRTAGQHAAVVAVVVGMGLVALGSLIAGAAAWWVGQPSLITQPLLQVGAIFLPILLGFGPRRIRAHNPSGEDRPA